MGNSSKRKQVEDVLKSENICGAIVEAAQDAIFIINREDRIEYVNSFGARLFELQPEKVVGRKRETLFPADILALQEDNLKKVFETGRPLETEERIVFPKGEIWMHTSLVPMRNEAGEVNAVMGISRDISEQKKAEDMLRKSKDLLKSIVENAPVRIFWKDRDSRYLGCNTQFAKDAGHSSPDELTGKTDFEMGWKDQAELYRADDKAVMESGNPKLDYEEPSTTSDGNMIWLSTSKVPLRDDKNHIFGVLGIYEDITVRKRMEEALKEECDMTQMYLDIAGVVIVAIDKNQKVTLINKKGCELLGCQEGDIIGRNWFDFIPERVRPKVKSDFARIIAGDVKLFEYYENPIINNNGEERIIAWHNAVITDKKGNITETLSSGADITDRKRMEEELLLLYTLIQETSLSEDFRSAIELTLLRICEATGWVMGEAWIPSADRSHLECSPAWYGGFEGLKKFRKISEGFSFQPGVGLPGRSWSSKKPVWDTDVTQDSNFPRATYAREAGLKGAMAIPILAGDEVVAVMDFFVLEPREEDRRLVGLVSTIAAYMGTIFQRKQVEEELRKLYHAVEQSPASIFIMDAAFNIEYINPKFIEITGYSREDAIGKKPDIISSGTAMISDTEWRGEFLAKKKNGDPFWEYATISPIRNAQGVITNFIGIHEDITERRKLEDQLRHSQKLEALGQLVGGIAHDFNNMLTAIIGFAGILQMKMKKDDPLMVNVEQVIEAAKRGASLTSSLLVFGRKQAIFPRPVNLNEIIDKVEKLLLRLIGEEIELKIIIADKELNVTVDPLQIEQALINLATNARDAMRKEGVLTIETGREKIDKNFIHSHGYGEPGEYALISVSDTGTGMDEKTREKVFEPFFTTKEVGKGTGLGLAIVYGIVKQHNGYITVYSEVGKGTTFKIYIPMTRPGVGEAVPVETVNYPPSAAPATGTETVLVAEDDKIVRKLSKDLLETFGYTVIEAANGEEAVQKYMENKDIIKLLILDVIMPKKNGKEAYEEIKRIAPDVRVIFMSGYTADIMHTKGIIENGMVFVSKPISPTDFIKKVREVLDR